MNVAQLQRVRWAVRATLVLGVAASVAANILHAQDNPISQVIAAWPPLALLLTVELISRIPVHRRSLTIVRLAATATIAGIAAWVSYWHMVGVASRYGETGLSPYLLPLSVDGLVIVASVSLVELAGRIRAAETTEAGTPVTSPADVPAPVDPPATEQLVAGAEQPRPAKRTPAAPGGQVKTPAKSQLWRAEYDRIIAAGGTPTPSDLYNVAGGREDSSNAAKYIRKWDAERVVAEAEHLVATGASS